MSFAGRIFPRTTRSLGRSIAGSRPDRSLLDFRPSTEALDERVIVARRYDEYVLLPLWLASGVADYFCHRRLKIETTSGFSESLLHLMMQGEAGVPVLASLFLETNAAVIGLSILGFVAHQLTMAWDLSYAARWRPMPPTEQLIHGSLEMMPFCSLSFMICQHWDQFKALLRGTPELLQLKLKDRPLPRAYTRSITLGAASVGLLFLEEAWRCIKASRKGLAGVDTPPALRQLQTQLETQY